MHVFSIDKCDVQKCKKYIYILNSNRSIIRRINKKQYVMKGTKVPNLAVVSKLFINSMPA